MEKSETWFIQFFQLTSLVGLLIAYCLSETLKWAGSKMKSRNEVYGMEDQRNGIRDQQGGIWDPSPEISDH